MDILLASAEGDLHLLDLWAKHLTDVLAPGVPLLLDGEMGTGKTTFVSLLARHLGITAPVTSPTFTLVHRYKGPRPMSHLDLYRLSPEEMGDIDLDRILETETDIVVIEWPDKTALVSQARYLKLTLAYLPATHEDFLTKRRFTLFASPEMEEPITRPLKEALQTVQQHPY